MSYTPYVKEPMVFYEIIRPLPPSPDEPARVMTPADTAALLALMKQPHRAPPPVPWVEEAAHVPLSPADTALLAAMKYPHRAPPPVPCVEEAAHMPLFDMDDV